MDNWISAFVDRRSLSLKCVYRTDSHRTVKVSKLYDSNIISMLFCFFEKIGTFLDLQLFSSRFEYRQLNIAQAVTEWFSMLFCCGKKTPTTSFRLSFELALRYSVRSSHPHFKRKWDAEFRFDNQYFALVSFQTLFREPLVFIPASFFKKQEESQQRYPAPLGLLIGFWSFLPGPAHSFAFRSLIVVLS